ncbi:hypothetical protein G6O67_002812 [Ophiocordyceps sinensis]|uniref:Uncharacterized protein n=1 Tax=Ophiocordyceps sinensis TaxID=72228 RepID=A0A8H4PV11_9HYPO|nr:hypothetical protein G6O67_002812 [Ophiocordyceps sinensis]
MATNGSCSASEARGRSSFSPVLFLAQRVPFLFSFLLPHQRFLLPHQRFHIASHAPPHAAVRSSLSRVSLRASPPPAWTLLAPAARRRTSFPFTGGAPARQPRGGLVTRTIGHAPTIVSRLVLVGTEELGVDACTTIDYYNPTVKISRLAADDSTNLSSIIQERANMLEGARVALAELEDERQEEGRKAARVNEPRTPTRRRRGELRGDAAMELHSLVGEAIGSRVAGLSYEVTMAGRKIKVPSSSHPTLSRAHSLYAPDLAAPTVHVTTRTSGDPRTADHGRSCSSPDEGRQRQRLMVLIPGKRVEPQPLGPITLQGFTGNIFHVNNDPMGNALGAAQIASTLAEALQAASAGDLSPAHSAKIQAILQSQH